MEFFVSLGGPAKQRTDCAIVGVYDKGTLSAAAEELDKRIGGRIARLVKRGDLRGKTGDVVAELERATTRAPALAERPEFAFWSGNVLLRRALEATDSEIIIKHLYAAAAHYRKALEAAPGDWDVKYNYELVQHVLKEQEQEKEKEDSKMKSILERIRTTTEPAPKEPPPPEKQG